jgi:DNA-binding MarR family transcriptional regulator
MSTLEKFLELRSFVNNFEKKSLVYGASFSEFLILRAVAAEGANGIRRVDLAELVGLSISGITRALQPLEKLGYIQTQDETLDARVRKVMISKSGSELYADIAKDVQRRMGEVDAQLNALLGVSMGAK